MGDRKRKRVEAVAGETTSKGKEKEVKTENGKDKEKIDPDIRDVLLREAYGLKKLKKEKAAESKKKREREANDKVVEPEVSHLPIKVEQPAEEPQQKKVKLNPQEETIEHHRKNLIEFLREVVNPEKHAWIDQMADVPIANFIDIFKQQAIPLWKIGMISTVADMIMMKANVTKEDVRNYDVNMPLFKNTIFLMCKLISTMR